MADLGSAAVQAPGDGDWVRGPAGAPLVVVWSDFECPYCALLHARLASAGDGVRVCFRHFPLRAAHPRARPAAFAAEAAGRQGAFWAMHDALFADQGRLDDPHLWARAEALGLDVARFETDRRDPEVAARVDAQLRAGIRCGVATTPHLVVLPGGRVLAGWVAPDELAAALGAGA